MRGLSRKREKLKCFKRKYPLKGRDRNKVYAGQWKVSRCGECHMGGLQTCEGEGELSWDGVAAKENSMLLLALDRQSVG
jgi:hypothetical protein